MSTKKGPVDFRYGTGTKDGNGRTKSIEEWMGSDDE
jgi:hypothetical protein